MRELEKRKLEKQRLYQSEQKNFGPKYYFPEILLTNKYDINEKILSKLPYIPETFKPNGSQSMTIPKHDSMINTRQGSLYNYGGGGLMESNYRRDYEQ